MEQTILLGAAIGAMSGIFLSLPALVLKVFSREQWLPAIVDVKEVWGKQLTPREVFAISLLFHLLFSIAVGALYVFIAEKDWLLSPHPFRFVSIMEFTVVTWILAGLILYPILGMGIFARMEGKHMWFETLISHVLIGVFYWLGVLYYHPFFF